MSKTILKAAAGVVALAAVAVGASTISRGSNDSATAATPAAAGSGYGSPYGPPPGRMGRFRGGPPQVTGAAADKVKAAALDKYPGAKIERIDRLPDGTYVAHVIKPDGSELHVAVNKQFEVTGLATRPAPGPGGPGGRDCPGGRHGDGDGPPAGARGDMPPPPPPGAPYGDRARPQAPPAPSSGGAST